MADTGGIPRDVIASISPMSSRKRKADELSSDDSGDLPHLPAPVWGHVLDFMPYTEVRSVLLVGKHIAVEVTGNRTVNLVVWLLITVDAVDDAEAEAEPNDSESISDKAVSTLTLMGRPELLMELLLVPFPTML